MVRSIDLQGPSLNKVDRVGEVYVLTCFKVLRRHLPEHQSGDLTTAVWATQTQHLYIFRINPGARGQLPNCTARF